MHLLTPAHANAKTAKNKKFSKYLTYILHLAPSSLSGFQVCPNASPGCKAACLNSAGRGAFSNVQAARVRKTRMLFTQRTYFFRSLIKDINAALRKAKRERKILVLRLNGTSDLPWESMKTPDESISLMKLFPSVLFYDYTKSESRMIHSLTDPTWPKNYHLTFSRSELNDEAVTRILDQGGNVAIVTRGLAKLSSHPTQSGDEHDLRFLDAKHALGSFITLTPKGKARKDTSGFVID